MEYQTVELGRKVESTEVIIADGVEASEPIYPRLYISDVEMPDIEEDEFDAKVRLRKVRTTKDHKDGEYSCEYEVLKMAVPTPKKKTLDEEFDSFIASKNSDTYEE